MAKQGRRYGPGKSTVNDGWRAEVIGPEGLPWTRPGGLGASIVGTYGKTRPEKDGTMTHCLKEAGKAGAADPDTLTMPAAGALALRRGGRTYCLREL